MDIWQKWERYNAAKRGMGNRLREQNLPQFMGVMGLTGEADQTDPQTGLTYGGYGTPSGLMAGDLQDPRTWMKAATGLMAIPGYQDMGAQMLQNAMTQQLGLPMMQQQMRQQQQMENLRMRKLNAELDRLDREIGEKQLAQTSSWYKDYRADTAGLRDALMQSNTGLARIAEKGLSDISNADLVGVMTGIAKLRDPGVALVQGDIDTLAAAKGWSGAEQAALRLLRLDGKIPFDVRQDLAATLLNEQESRQIELDQRRTIWANRASEYNLRGAEMLPEIGRPDRAAVQNRLDEKGPGEIDLPGSNDVDPETAAAVKAQVEAENPGFFDRLFR